LVNLFEANGGAGPKMSGGKDLFDYAFAAQGAQPKGFPRLPPTR